MFGRLVACVVVVASVGVGAPALATTAPAVPSADIHQMPLVESTAPMDARVVAASPSYVVHAGAGPVDLEQPGALAVRRVADSATVWTGRLPAGVTRVDIAGDDLATFVEDPAASNRGEVSFRNVLTGAVDGSTVIPSGEALLGVGDRAVLTTFWVGNNRFGLRVRRADGTVADVAGVTVGYWPSVRRVAGSKMFVFDGSDPQVLAEIDLSAATSRVIAGPSNGRWDQWVVVGPRRAYSMYGDSSGLTVRWTDLATGEMGGGSVADAPGFTGQPVAYGDGFAWYDGATQHPVMTAVGADLGAAESVASDVYNAVALGDGRVAVGERSRYPREIRVVSAGEPDLPLTLPPFYEQASDLRFDGSVAAAWNDSASEIPADGSGSWTPTAPLGLTAGGTRLERVAGTDDDWTLSWPGGSRTITGSGFTLAHGGSLVQGVFENASTDAAQVQRVATGEVLWSGRLGAAAGDGSWLWTISPDGVLSGRDVDDATTPVRTIPTGLSYCYTVQARGRWALVRCSGAWSVVDTLGVVATWALPVSPRNPGRAPLDPPQLGSDFVAWPEFPDSDDAVRTFLFAADLTPDHVTRFVGSLAYDTNGISTDFSVDEAGSKRIAFRDHNLWVSVANLPWLGAAPTVKPDTTAPTLAALAGGPRFGRTDASGKLSWRYAASDTGSGVATYDVQTKSAAPGHTLGPWTDAALATSATSFTHAAVRGSDWCLRFRARDHAGNVSGWSAARCTAVAIDDRALVLSAGTRSTWSGALYGTYTSLGARATLVHRATNVGATLGVWVVKGVRQGYVDVYVGGVKAGRISLAATSSRRVLVTMAMPRSGTVKFVRVGKGGARVDAFAVAR
ncbi:hypothetical protein GCM10011584_31390 [Nocardioides phosphati]|uniref:LamG domain-containing protein n=1 Tax=Nocardioides phosphati TaxID=1867775 RepID=A0ABQ2NCX6_9ACTN|nr:hypothetical protein GCM10011584_31390 [Nocardioides phosphati]